MTRHNPCAGANRPNKNGKRNRRSSGPDRGVVGFLMGRSEVSSRAVSGYSALDASRGNALVVDPAAFL
jgi:hypothetical protein